MTKVEFSVLLKAIKDIYDREGFIDTDSKKATWYALLKDLDYHAAASGLQAYMSSPDGHFELKPADIRTYALKMQPKGDTPTETEALALVVKAVRNGIYGAEDEYAKLPAVVQKAVGSPTMLTEWAVTPSESAEVWHSNFLRTYRTVSGRVEKERALPEKMRVYTSSIVERERHPQITQKPERDVSMDQADTLSGEAENAIKRMREALETITA